MAKRKTLTLRTTLGVASMLALIGGLAHSQALARDCSAVMAALAANPAVADVECFVSSDLTTANPRTTPPDNSLPGLPPGAFTPRSDAASQMSTGPGSRYPITMEVPGLQISGRMADSVMARWVIRLPNTWNHRLLVAPAHGQKSEYSTDIMYSNYAVQQGYAFASNNKGHFQYRPTSADNPKGCVNPPGGTGYIVSYWTDLPREEIFAGFFSRPLEVTSLTKSLTRVQYGDTPQYTYLGGMSISATIARSLIERAPDVYDGAVGWAPPYATALGEPSSEDDDGDHGHGESHANFNNFLNVFSVGLKKFPDFRDSGFDQSSAAYLALTTLFPRETNGAPHPPVSDTGSYYETNYNGPWQNLQCGDVRLLDPTYVAPDPTLPTVFKDYDYPTRYRVAHMEPIFRAFGSTGRLSRPLIEVHGTEDASAVLKGTRFYASDVARHGRSRCHRVYEVTAGSHRDAFRDAPTSFLDIEPMGLKLIAAFERLVTWVERGIPAPASQCIPRGGTIVSDPAAIGRPRICPDYLPGADEDRDHDHDDDGEPCVGGHHGDDDHGDGPGDHDWQNDH